MIKLEPYKAYRYSRHRAVIKSDKASDYDKRV